MYQRHAECGGVTWIPPEAKTEHIAVQCDACEDVFVISGEVSDGRRPEPYPTNLPYPN
jgi:hypothetical protein